MFYAVVNIVLVYCCFRVRCCVLCSVLSKVVHVVWFVRCLGYYVFSVFVCYCVFGLVSLRVLCIVCCLLCVHVLLCGMCLCWNLC